MKIMILADEESKSLWDYFDKSKLEGIDLIISCGDLDPRYLSFLATFTTAPVLYVHGNHDERYDKIPPDGCICIDGSVYEFQGLRIVGLGGSMQYKPGKHMYTQHEMDRRVHKLLSWMQRRRGFDILVTHAPAKGRGDDRDLPHQGFEAFVKLVDRYQPQFHFYGHVHKNYGGGFQREMMVGETRAINAYEKYIVEVEPPAPAEPKRFQRHKRPRSEGRVIRKIKER